MSVPNARRSLWPRYARGSARDSHATQACLTSQHFDPVLLTLTPYLGVKVRSTKVKLAEQVEDSLSLPSCLAATRSLLI